MTGQEQIAVLTLLLIEERQRRATADRLLEQALARIRDLEAGIDLKPPTNGRTTLAL